MHESNAVSSRDGDIVNLPNAQSKSAGVISVFKFALKIFSIKSSNQSSEPIFALSAELFSAADDAYKNLGA